MISRAWRWFLGVGALIFISLAESDGSDSDSGNSDSGDSGGSASSDNDSSGSDSEGLLMLGYLSDSTSPHNQRTSSDDSSYSDSSEDPNKRRGKTKPGSPGSTSDMSQHDLQDIHYDSDTGDSYGSSDSDSGGDSDGGSND